MKARISNKFVLILSLALLSNAWGAAAQVPAHTLPSGQWEDGQEVATRQQVHNVRLVGSIGGGATYAVAVAGSYAYVADGWRGMRILDITDPADPTEVGFYILSRFAWQVALAGNYAYVADDFGGLVILGYLPYQMHLPLGLHN